MEINGYVMEGEFSSENAGCSRWGFCRKYEHSFFIKKFTDVTYPISDKLSPAILSKKRKKCQDFFDRKIRFYKILSQCRNGNNIIIHDFFRYETSYYAVTDRVKQKPLNITEIVSLSAEKKILLFKSILYSFAMLEKNGLVHSDVKPENILVVNTYDGYCTGKIIDFDMGFSVDDQPDEFGGDYLYYSPEVLQRVKGEKSFISPAIDVFALGILFHEYWTGYRPNLPSGYNYICECINDGKRLSYDSEIPETVLSMIRLMLRKNPKNRITASKALNLLVDMDIPKEDHVHEEVKTVDSNFSGLKVRMKSKTTSNSACSKKISCSHSETAAKNKDFFRPTDFD